MKKNFFLPIVNDPVIFPLNTPDFEIVGILSNEPINPPTLFFPNTIFLLELIGKPRLWQSEILSSFDLPINPPTSLHKDALTNVFWIVMF